MEKRLEREEEAEEEMEEDGQDLRTKMSKNPMQSIEQAHAVKMKRISHDLMKAAHEGRLGEVKELVKAGADPLARSGAGWTIGHVAADTGNLAMLKWWAGLEGNRNGLKAMTFEKVGISHLAAMAPSPNMLNWLAKKGADLNAKTASGWTVGHFAANLGHERTLAEWLKKGGDVNARDSQGRTIGHVAAENGRLKALKVWADAGGDLSARDRRKSRGNFTTSNSAELVAENQGQSVRDVGNAEVREFLDSLEFKKIAKSFRPRKRK